VGGLRAVDTMNAILSETGIQLLSLSRPLVRDPALPNQWGRDPAHIARCVSCNACYRTPAHRCPFLK